MSKINAAAEASEDLLEELHEGSIDNIKCNDLLQKIVILFSTKGEIDIARDLFGDFDIEESGEEGDLELF